VHVEAQPHGQGDWVNMGEVESGCKNSLYDREWDRIDLAIF
jgi:hypothetical protein